MSEKSTAKRMMLEKKIERLDREWLLEREKFRIATEYSSVLPDKYTGLITIISMVTGVGFVLYWLSDILEIAEKHPGNGSKVMLAIGVVFLIVLVVTSLQNLKKVKGYSEALKDYEGEREALLDELARLEW